MGDALVSAIGGGVVSATIPPWHPRRARTNMVLASQAEDLTAVELHNNPVTPRPLEQRIHVRLGSTKVQ